MLSDKCQETVRGLRRGSGRGAACTLPDCELQRPRNENWVLLILIRETLNKIYLETVPLAVPFPEWWEFLSFNQIPLTSQVK